MYKYRVTLEALDWSAEVSEQTRSLQFAVQNHDDLFRIIEAVRAKGILDEDKSTALAVGLKLFSEVVLEKRRDPLFTPLSEPLRSFTQQLKRTGFDRASE